MNSDVTSVVQLVKKQVAAKYRTLLASAPWWRRRRRWRGRRWRGRRWRGRRRERRRRALVATSVRTASCTSESARATTCRSRMSCTRHRDRPRERTAHEPLDARERWVWLERLRLERLRPEWRQRSGLRLSSGRWGGSTTGGRQLAATASRAGSMPDPSACDATRREQQSSVGAAAAHQHRSPAGVAAARRRGTKHAPFSRRRRRSTSRSFPSAFCRARKLLALGKGFRKWPG